MAHKSTIKIGHIRITDHLVLGVTKDRFDKREESFDHVKLEPKCFVGWNPLAKALEDGDIDGAFILAPLAMELFHSGVKMRLIGFGHRSGSVIIKNKLAHIETIEDFKGKIVLIPHTLSVHNIIFTRLLEEKGLSVGLGKDVKLEVVAPSQIPQIMRWDKNGSIGGFIVAEPFGSQVVIDDMGEEFALSKDIWPDHPCCVIVIRDEVLQSNPDGVQELMNSFVKSGQYIESHKPEAAKIGANFLKQNVAVIERVLTEPYDRITTGRMYPTLDELETMQSYLTEKRQFMSGKVDLEKFVTTEFADTSGAKK